MEGLKPALAASAGLHLAVLVALSVAPIRLKAPPLPGDAIIPVEIVSPGPSRAPASDVAAARPSPAEAAPDGSAATTAADTAEAAAPKKAHAVENPPLPAPKPRRPPVVPEPHPEPRPRETATAVESNAPATTEQSKARQVGGAGSAADITTGPPWAESGGPITGLAEPSPGAGSDALEAYFAELQRWLEKHKRYPRMAQVRGQEGTGMLRFTLDRSGRVLSYRLQDGTGHAALDREIEAMIERAQPLPPIPQDLSQPTLDLAIPVSFRLR